MTLQVPRSQAVRESEGKPYAKPKWLFVAEAVLEASGIQDLADQIPAITTTAVGNDLRFTVRVELGGETEPDQQVVEKINALLAEVSETMKLEG